jgi:polar amino acid transport system substrate-binding protein
LLAKITNICYDELYIRFVAGDKNKTRGSYLMKRMLLPFALIVLLALTGCGVKEIKTEEFNIETARIGTMTGTTGEFFAIDAYPDAQIESFGSVMDAVAALKAGRVDAVVTADVTCRNIERENPDLERLPELLTHENVSVGIKKGNEQLLSEINSVIKKLKEDGTLDNMAERWVESYPPVYETIDEADGEVLRVGTDPTRVPFTYLDSESVNVGFSPELARRIGLALGRKVEFVSLDFAALIPSLESGKIDCIVDMMSATDERKKSINFSDTFYLSGQNILKRRDETSSAYEAQTPGFFESLKNSFTQNLITENRWKLIVDGLCISLLITAFAFLLATILGFVVCGFRMSKNPILKGIGSVYITVLRGTPVLVLLMITFYVIFAKSSISGTVVAIIAFGVNGAAFIGEIFRSAILTIDKGQVEAARSMGFSKIGAFFTVTLPQAARVAFPVYKSEFISMFKMTSVVGYVAIMDLTKAGDIIRSRTYDAFFPLIFVALVYLIAASLMIFLFDRIDAATNKRLRRKNR